MGWYIAMVSLLSRHKHYYGWNKVKIAECSRHAGPCMKKMPGFMGSRKMPSFKARRKMSSTRQLLGIGFSPQHICKSCRKELE